MIYIQDMFARGGAIHRASSLQIGLRHTGRYHGVVLTGPRQES
jgi:hypothetical protein